jgi:hypothetical protein
VIKKLHEYKISIIVTAIACTLLLGHSFIAYKYYQKILSNMQDEVIEATNFDSNLEQLCRNDDSLRNAYHDLFFLQSQLALAKNDSAGLVVDIPNNMVFVQIKGVNVFKSTILEQEIDFILQDAGFHTYRYLHENPLKIQAEQANIEREPIVHIVAPADTAAARMAPKHEPDTTLLAIVNLDFLLDKNINLTISGQKVPTANGWFNEQVHGIYERLKLTQKMIIGIFSNQSPKHYFKIHLWVNNRDARIIYRALQTNSQVVIRY